jgi:hypothetical protein
MTWVYLDDNWDHCIKITTLSDLAKLVWVRGITYSRRNMTDGFIPDSEVDLFLDSKNRKQIKKIVEELTSKPIHVNKKQLWHRVEGGYVINDYHDWNKTSEEIKNERNISKERVKRHRDRACNAVTPPLQHGTSNAVTPPLQPPPCNACVTPSPSPSPLPSPIPYPTDTGDVAPAPTPAGDEFTNPKKPRKEKQVDMNLPTSLASEVGWECWRKIYEGSQRCYGKYTSGPDDGATMKKIVEHATKLSTEELHRRGTSSWQELERICTELLAHWFKGYIRKDGVKDFLIENKHSLRFFTREIPSLGQPRSWSRWTQETGAQESFEAALAGIGRPTHV